MLDTNLTMDAGKLEHFSQIPEGGQVVLNLMREFHRTMTAELADRFGIRQMLADESKDHTFMVSFLYCFGVLTMEGDTPLGKIALKVPNLFVRRLCAEQRCCPGKNVSSVSAISTGW